MREIEAHALVVFVGTGLMHMRAQHLAQRLLQKVRARVVAHDGMAALPLHAGQRLVAHVHHAVQQRASVHIVALRRFFARRHREMCAARRSDHAGIGHLSAALCVKRRAIQHHQNALFRAVVGGNGVRQLFAVRDGRDLGLGLQRLIAQKLCRGQLQRAEQIGRPAGNITAAAILPRFFALLLQLGAEAFLVHLNVVFGRDLFGEVQREAERIVQLERVDARQHAALALGGCLFDVVDQV